MSIRQVTVLAMLAGAISGCATLNKDECLTADWETIGLEDGAQGFAAERIGDHRRACAKHGITPDLAAYEAGRARGLRSYCTPHNGYQRGRSGTSGLEGLCPADLAPAFLAAHASGRRVFQAAAEESRARAALEAAQDELARIEEAIEVQRSIIVSESSTPRQREDALEALEQLRQDRRFLIEDSLPALDAEALHQTEIYQRVLAAEPAPP